jgi:hypothetical protein
MRVLTRRHVLAAALVAVAAPAVAQSSAITSEKILQDWYRLVLQLVRHTPTYSPPVASRAFAYLGIAVHEAVAACDDKALSLSAQINGLPVSARGEVALLPHLLNATLERAVADFFGNTGPSGQRAIKAMSRKNAAALMGTAADSAAARAEDLGHGIASSVFDWSKSDGGHGVENLGFPLQHVLGGTPASWVPTNPQTLQQTPLLPTWGSNRTFALPTGNACPLPPPPDYSEDKGSAFYGEALEAYAISKSLTDEQKRIARFWSDDPMLSPTPPGHWVSIALQIFEKEKVDARTRAAVLARLGIAMADAFIGCWHTKYEYDLLRPITYIRRVIDPKWTPFLITPPFPEYPSGHSTQSGAAEVVLSEAFGANHAFVDATHERDGLAPRAFTSFTAAAEEAALSRLYGGIHFRSGVERGLKQGRCIGGHALKLKLAS